MIGTVGVCPACEGSGRRPLPEDMRRYAPNIYGYDAETDTLPCRNCGGMQMSGRATGVVPLREDGTPCLHEYKVTTIGRCLNEYRCNYCPSKFELDSGD